jgi:hypothetical protein
LYITAQIVRFQLGNRGKLDNTKTNGKEPVN